MTMQDESPEAARPRNLMWVVRYEGRLVYIPHENIEMIISNLDYNGNPVPRVPIRIMRMTRENEATYFDLDPAAETMSDLVSRVIDLGRIVDYNEDLRAQQILLTQARMAQQGAQEPVQSQNVAMPEQPVARGERTKSSFPAPIPPSREEQAVAEAESWDQEGAIQGQVTEQAAQALIEEVVPPAAPPPQAARVRRGRNGNRRA